MTQSVRTYVAKIFAILSILFMTVAINPTVSYAAGETKTSGSVGADLNGFSVTMQSGSGFTVQGAGFGQTRKEAWDGFINKYKNFIVGVGAMATVTMIGVFIWMAGKLGLSTGNEQARRQAISGLLYAGIATAMLGTITTLVAFLYSAFK